MHECPIGGHQGVQRTYERLNLYVTWPGMFHDVEEYIRKCDIRQKNKFTRTSINAQFQETDTQYQPWDKLYLDIVGPFPMTDEGYRYIFTCQDNLRKYLIPVPMMTQTTDEVSFAMSTLVRFSLRLAHWYDMRFTKVTHAIAHALNMLNGVENSNACSSARESDSSGFTFNIAFNFCLLIQGVPGGTDQTSGGCSLC